MARPKRTAEQTAIDSRRSKVAELHAQGYRTATAIAERLTELGWKAANRRTIGHDLIVVRGWWRDAGVKSMDEWMLEQLAKLDRIEQVAWDAWEKSTGPRERSRTGKTTGDAGARTIAQIDKQDSHGDPRYLAIIYQCIDRRCKLLGLDKPTKVIIGDEQINDAIEVEFKTQIEQQTADPTQTTKG